MLGHGWGERSRRQGCPVWLEQVRSGVPFRLFHPFPSKPALQPHLTTLLHPPPSQLHPNYIPHAHYPTHASHRYISVDIQQITHTKVPGMLLLFYRQFLCWGVIFLPHFPLLLLLRHLRLLRCFFEGVYQGPQELSLERASGSRAAAIERKGRWLAPAWMTRRERELLSKVAERGQVGCFGTNDNVLRLLIRPSAIKEPLLSLPSLLSKALHFRSIIFSR